MLNKSISNLTTRFLFHPEHEQLKTAKYTSLPASVNALLVTCAQTMNEK